MLRSTPDRDLQAAGFLKSFCSQGGAGFQEKNTAVKKYFQQSVGN